MHCEQTFLLLKRALKCKRLGKGHRLLAMELQALLSELRFAILVDQIVLDLDDIRCLLLELSSSFQLNIKAFVYNENFVFLVNASRLESMIRMQSRSIVDISINLQKPKLLSADESSDMLGDVYKKYFDRILKEDQSSLLEMTVEPNVLPLISGMILGYPCVYTTKTDKTCLSGQQLKRVTISASSNLIEEPLIAYCYTIPVSGEEQENIIYSNLIEKHFELVKTMKQYKSWQWSCNVDAIKVPIALV